MGGLAYRLAHRPIYYWIIQEVRMTDSQDAVAVDKAVEVNKLLLRIESLEAELKLWKNQPDHYCGDDCHHDSDCSLHNNPAYPRQPCDCSLQEPK